jgi:hypothetical protein
VPPEIDHQPASCAWLWSRHGRLWPAGTLTIDF